jgi:hypothetical protein
MKPLRLFPKHLFTILLCTTIATQGLAQLTFPTIRQLKKANNFKSLKPADISTIPKDLLKIEKITDPNRINFIIEGDSNRYKIFEAFRTNYNMADVTSTGEIGAKAPSSSFSLETLPSIIGTSTRILPTINIVGNSEGGSGKTRYYGYVFVGASGTDTSRQDNLSRLLVPNLSSFGITFGVAHELFSKDKTKKKDRNLSIGGEVGFLWKKFKDNDLKSEDKTFNVPIIHLHPMLRWAPVSFLELYGGYNLLIPIAESKLYRNYFAPLNKNILGYFNTGFVADFALTNDETKHLLVNLNLLMHTSKTRNLMSGESKPAFKDLAIPILEIGYRSKISR